MLFPFLNLESVEVRKISTGQIRISVAVVHSRSLIILFPINHQVFFSLTTVLYTAGNVGVSRQEKSGKGPCNVSKHPCPHSQDMRSFLSLIFMPGIHARLLTKLKAYMKKRHLVLEQRTRKRGILKLLGEWLVRS